MLSVKITSFPNREIRIRCAPLGIKRGSLSHESQGETKERKSRSTHLTLAPNSKPEKTEQKSILKTGYGGRAKPTKFGLYAKRTLLRVGGVIDQIDDNPENGIFLTGTLPGSTHAAMQAIADYSGYIVHRLKAWVNKHVREKMDFYVWERQSRGALHLHYYCYVPDTVQRDYLLMHFREWWIGILKNVSSQSGIDLFQKSKNYSHRSNLSSVQAYAQTVKKSVAAYLSKYCSKQSSKQSSQRSRQYYPSRWWGASRPLLAKLREMTQSAESVFSSYRKGRSEYEELVALLERFSIKGYRYGDRVGLGLNHVFYFSSEEHLKCFQQVRQTMTELKSSSTMTVEDAAAEIRRMIEFLRCNQKTFARYWNDLSEQSRRGITKLLEFQPIPVMDLWAIAAETEAICGYLLSCDAMTPQAWNRAVVRSRILSQFLRNQVFIETMIVIPESKSAG